LSFTHPPPHPPRPPLFPYTTLFRSPFARHAYSFVGMKRATVQVEDARGNEDSASVRIDVRPESPPTGAPDLTPASASTIPARDRSEEHTSELQSRFDLVCRLLLEKK